MTRGTLFGVSVGPGDPELLTLRAARILREADCIAAPDIGKSARVALHIVEPFIAGKPIVDCSTPMTRDREATARAYDAIADRLSELLDAGKSVAFITLGDAGVFSTWSYVLERMRPRGYDIEVVPGVTSFCAAAARLGQPLCERDEQLLVVPVAAGDPQAALDVPGTKVFMKSGSKLSDLQALLRERGAAASMVANCGLEGEEVVPDFLALDDAAGYMAVVIARDATAPAGDGRAAGAGAPAGDGRAAGAGAPAGESASAGDGPSAGESASAGDGPRAGFSFFQNRTCEYFPCHEGVDADSFNCLFCYCPLYALGEACGGDFRYTQSGVKDCTACTRLHEGDAGVQLVKDGFSRLRELAGAGRASAEAPRPEGC